MLNERIRANRDLTERELQKIARDMYKERLRELCTQRRATFGNAEFLSAANNAYVDYFDRLAEVGGHVSLLPGEEDRLRAEGWDERRVTDLRRTIHSRAASSLASGRQTGCFESEFGACTQLSV